MSVSKWVLGAGGGIAALAAVGAIAQAPVKKNWIAVIAPTDGGHRIGNPAAKVKLTEYISYTCPHCAAFARDGEGALHLAYIETGKINLEVRHLIRDPIDLTAALLVNCGPPGKFLQNHQAFMLGQSQWIAPMVTASATQQARWRLPGATGRRAIANDFKFYDLMERRGYTHTQTDKCLADEPAARKMAATAAADWKLPGVEGTPAFAIDGLILSGTASWKALAPQLDARL
ncbi:MAG: thioredoxin domain-containing protein [Croceibacterium sp.]